jgi:hypothetical protein
LSTKFASKGRMANYTFYTRTLLVFISILIGPFLARASVWENQSQWTPQKEKDFQSWVLTDWNKNFFANKLRADGSPNPYYGILNDCADTVYTMRLVFAYENGLPFEINDPTGGPYHISNQMIRWDREKNEIKRVRSFIKYIHNIVSTNTLPNDTYPVAISRETMVPGSLLLTGRASHHSWTLKKMLSIGVPHLIYNSRVGAMSSAVLQERKTWPNPDWIFKDMGADRSRAGFRYWKPIDQLETPALLLPEASDEQFRIPLRKWVSTIQAKIATEQETTEAALNRVLEASCDGFMSRVNDVQEAMAVKRNSALLCLTPADYDQYSTPSRDHRVFDDLMILRDLYVKSRRSGDLLSTHLQRQLQKIFPNPSLGAQAEAKQTPALAIDQDSVCPIRYAAGKTIDLAEAKRRMFIGKMSSDPNHSLGLRWGESQPVSEPSDLCPGEKLWKPFQ